MVFHYYFLSMWFFSISKHKCTEFDGECSLSLPNSVSRQPTAPLAHTFPPLQHKVNRHLTFGHLHTTKTWHLENKHTLCHCHSLGKIRHHILVPATCCKGRCSPSRFWQQCSRTWSTVTGIFSRASCLGPNGPQSQSRRKPAATWVYSYQLL